MFSKYHWLIILLTFILIGFSIYFPLVNYDKLPDRIPTHFNAMGEPDSWSNKNTYKLLLGPLITLPTLLIMLPIIWWIATVKDPRKIINAPRDKVQNMSWEKAEQIRRIVVFHMLLINLLVAALIMFVSTGLTLVAMGKQTTLGWPVPLTVFLLLGDTFFLTWKTIRLVYK